MDKERRLKKPYGVSVARMPLEHLGLVQLQIGLYLKGFFMGTEGPLNNEEFAKEVMKFYDPNAKFEPQVFYNKDGDLIEVMWENVEWYGEWINCNLTVYRAEKDDRVIGCEINWIKNLIKKNK